MVLAVYRVGGAWGGCAWCVFPASGAAEIIGVGRALFPPLGLLLLSASSALRVPPGRRRPVAPAPSCPVFVLRVWSFLRAMYLGVELPPVGAPHTILLCVVICACAPYTGLVSGIPLALGFGVSWILLARCSSLHKLRSLSSASGSHVEELRHIG